MCAAGGADSCWWWTGAINGGTGHGELHLASLRSPDGRSFEWVEYAHRIAFVLAGAKALLEHDVRLNLVPDRFPDGLPRD